MTARKIMHKSAYTYEQGMSAPNSDYTKWHQRFAAAVTPEMFASLTEESERDSPYTGKAVII